MSKAIYGGSMFAALVLAASLLLPEASSAQRNSRVERGRYLVEAMGCADCHTPFRLGPNGPEPDVERGLSGHPAELVMPPAPHLEPGPWLVVSSGTNTAWSGPWGVSFTSNLTPDEETGIGKWTLENFSAAMRTGRHLGAGRAILPPMPWQAVSKLTDDDLAAIFEYLKSRPPVPNRVPEPIAPQD
ncbi:MAG: c-type cytochrome [Planctomycetes bacterium]|nr:c-type cytochrome [Planctomycetota bacterium]